MLKRFLSKKTHLESAKLSSSYDICKTITKSNAKNFYYCFQVLPKNLKRSIYALYAFCRYCDDITDSNLSKSKKFNSLNTVKDNLNTSENLKFIYPALFDSIKKFSIPKKYFHMLLNGMEMDIEMKKNIAHYKTFNDLKKYCYHVSSVVGLMCIEVFGYNSSKATHYAIQLGYAMQITNITRDIFEDLDTGRIYIPEEDFSTCEYTLAELKKYKLNNNYKNLVKLQISRARKLFIESQNLLPLIPNKSRFCIAAIIEIYSRILDLIEKYDYDLINNHIHLSTKEKIIFMIKYYFSYSFSQIFKSNS